MEPVDLTLGGEEWWAFDELANDMEMVASAISDGISIEVLIGNVLSMTRFLGLASSVLA